MAANDYYDFNPSPTVWALMLSAIIVFVLALCLMLIYFVDRAGNEVNRVTERETTPEIAPRETVEAPTAKAS